MTTGRIAALLCAGLLLITPASAQFARRDAARAPGPAGPAIVLDAHVDSLHRILDRGDDLSETLADGQVDLPKLRAHIRKDLSSLIAFAQALDLQHITT